MDRLMPESAEKINFPGEDAIGKETRVPWDHATTTQSHNTSAERQGS